MSKVCLFYLYTVNVIGLLIRVMTVNDVTLPQGHTVTS